MKKSFDNTILNLMLECKLKKLGYMKKLLMCNSTTKHHIQIVRARFVQERIILLNISLEWAVKYIFKDAFWEFVGYSLDCGWCETASDTKAKVTKEIMNCHICKSLLILLIWNILMYFEQLLPAQTRHRIQKIFFQLKLEIINIIFIRNIIYQNKIAIDK